MLHVRLTNKEGLRHFLDVSVDENTTWSALRTHIQNQYSPFNHFVVKAEAVIYEHERIEAWVANPFSIVEVDCTCKVLTGLPVNVKLRVTGNVNSTYSVTTDTSYTWAEFKAQVKKLHNIEVSSLVVERETVRFDHEKLAAYDLCDGATIIGIYRYETGCTKLH